MTKKRKARYIYEWFPPIIEEEIDEVELLREMNEYEQEMLKDELGVMLFGNQFKTHGIGNPELPSRFAGQLGSTVKEWKGIINKEIIKNKTFN